MAYGKTCIEVSKARPIQPDNRRPTEIITYLIGFYKRVSPEKHRFFEYAVFHEKSVLVFQ